LRKIHKKEHNYFLNIGGQYGNTGKGWVKSNGGSSSNSRSGSSKNFGDLESEESKSGLKGRGGKHINNLKTKASRTSESSQSVERGGKRRLSFGTGSHSSYSNRGPHQM